jgi:hypothetical protein
MVSMANGTDTYDAFKNRCTNANRVLQSCVGYWIHRITLSENNEDWKDNSLDVWLRFGPSAPDVVISLAGLQSVRPWGEDPDWALVDEVAITHLPRLPSPWPVDAVDRLQRTEELPELAWLRITGFVEIDALGTIITVYRAQSDDESSILQ